MKPVKIIQTRRQFLRNTAALAACGICVPAFCSDAAPSNKLNVAVIGPCNRGAANLSGVIGENVVAICDVDSNYLEAASQRVPNARKFEDFRKMLEEMEDSLDAVVVSTPDHTHAVCAAMAMKMGKHCYCEKPLAHDVYETRTLQNIAAERKLVTQMGTQIHATENYRRVVELIQSGAIGTVTEVHTWFSGERPVKIGRPTNTPPVPASLNWDLWLGPVAYRPYSPEYCPGEWRRYWAFGNGLLGDFGCHHMDLPFWALKLRDCETVQSFGTQRDPEGVVGDLRVEYTFPARENGSLPPVRLTWYTSQMPPILEEKGVKNPPAAGNLFIGSRGMLVADYGMHRLLPEEQYADFVRPEKWLAPSVGHHAEWIQACKENNPAATTCAFGYSGRLSETVLLGLTAFKADAKLEWDADAMRVTNVPAANEFLRTPYRDGWTL